MKRNSSQQDSKLCDCGYKTEEFQMINDGLKEEWECEVEYYGD